MVVVVVGFLVVVFLMVGFLVVGFLVVGFLVVGFLVVGFLGVGFLVVGLVVVGFVHMFCPRQTNLRRDVTFGGLLWLKINLYLEQGEGNRGRNV